MLYDIERECSYKINAGKRQCLFANKPKGLAEAHVNRPEGNNYSYYGND